jgi:threonine/homoserine/homoserine lactone efflux protein
MLLVLSNSARFGLRDAMATTAGCMTSLLAMMSISAAGLGALLQMFPAVFDALRLVGVGYLAYLGIKIWRSPVHDHPVGTPEVIVPATKARALFRQGMMVAASNPKAILFAVAFLPQFIDPQNSQLPQFGILLSTFAVIAVSWYFVYAVRAVSL